MKFKKLLKIIGESWRNFNACNLQEHFTVKKLFILDVKKMFKIKLRELNAFCMQKDSPLIKINWQLKIKPNFLLHFFACY